jgi:hypothetical protein
LRHLARQENDRRVQCGLLVRTDRRGGEAVTARRRSAPTTEIGAGRGAGNRPDPCGSARSLHRGQGRHERLLGPLIALEPPGRGPAGAALRHPSSSLPTWCGRGYGPAGQPSRAEIGSPFEIPAPLDAASERRLQSSLRGPGRSRSSASSAFASSSLGPTFAGHSLLQATSNITRIP